MATTVRMRGKRNTTSSRNLFDDFCSLSYRILDCANLGMSRVDFLREVSGILMEFSGSEGIEFRLRDGELTYHWEATCRPVESFLFEPVRADQSEAADGRPALLSPGSVSLRQQRSVAEIAFVIDSENTGLLRLKRKKQERFAVHEQKFYESIAQILGIAIGYSRAQARLRERVKELTCLYGMAQVVGRPDLPLKETLHAIVGLLPPAWQYPDIASARIVLDGSQYSTPLFRECPLVQKADVIVDGKMRGVVQVAYAERPPLEPLSFLNEEQNLIDAVARQVALIVEQREAEEARSKLGEQLRHADRLATIGQLAAGVAHEINEPLGNILGFSQLAKKSPGLPAQAGQDLEKIVGSCLHAREIVKKLMLFARQMPPKKTKVSLNQIANEGLYFLESRCAKEGIEVMRSFSQNLPEITADPSQLHQVIVNLVVNAIQAMPNRGRLTIKTTAREKVVSLVVEDTGIGMSKDVLRQIFLPFFTTKEVGQGTGLGLPVVHGILTAHGGSIVVESEVGVGTRFEIELPMDGPANGQGG